MSLALNAVLAAAFALMTPVLAMAQETVKIGQDTKRAFGIVTSMNAGDTACYLGLKDDRGATFEEMARFEVCEQRTLLGKRVALTYVQQSVMSPDCQGDPACKKTRIVALVSAARPVAAAAATPSPTPNVKATQASFCTSEETVVFACRTGGKLVSVCASKVVGPNRGYLQYRFGKPDSADPLEMTLPESRLPPPKVASGETVPFSGGGGSWLRFSKPPMAYTVYGGIGRWGPNGETREKSGVVVERQGKQVATLRCAGTTTSELGYDWFARTGVKAAGQDFEFPD
jgi:hypothetical protein